MIRQDQSFDSSDESGGESSKKINTNILHPSPVLKVTDDLKV